MKRILTVASCILGFVLIAAPIYMNQPTYPVFLNGKPFGNAVNISGNLFISLGDFTKAAGGTLTLEHEGFKLQGTTLTTFTSQADTQVKHVEASAGANTIGGASINRPEGQSTVKLRGGSRLFHVRKAGNISTNVVMQGGKAFLPLADVVKAFGGTLTVNAGTLKPGEAIHLNFAGDVNGILAAGQ